MMQLQSMQIHLQRVFCGQKKRNRLSEMGNGNIKHTGEEPFKTSTCQINKIKMYASSNKMHVSLQDVKCFSSLPFRIHGLKETCLSFLHISRMRILLLAYGIVKRCK